jgi:hypothetical protein
MLRTLLIAAALAAPDQDPFVSVQSVELPAQGLDPHNMTIVLNESIKGCRRAGNPIVIRDGNVIRVLPTSDPVAKTRAPCSTGALITKEVVQLGSLDKGTYHVQVVTAKTRIFKVLNIY